jgi:hypothetical protein
MEPMRYDVANDAVAFFTPSWRADQEIETGYPGSYRPNDPNSVEAFVRKLDAWFTQDAFPRAQRWLSDPRLLLDELQDPRPYRYAATTVQVMGHPALQAVLAAEVGDHDKALALYSDVASLASSHPYGGEAHFQAFLAALREILPRHGVQIPA